MVEMVSGFISLAVVVGLIALIATGVRRRGPGVDARSVRRFFQYAVLYALVIVVALGVDELLGRLLGAEVPQWQDPSAELARGLAFTFVGGALALLLAWWTRRMHRADPTEAESPMWVAYVTLAALTGAVVAASSVQNVGYLLVSDGRLDAESAATFVPWAAVWWVHWEIARRTLDEPRQTAHLLLGSLVGLSFGTAGLVITLGTSLDLLLRPETVGRPLGMLGEGAATLLVGALIWVRYWATRAIALPRRPLWLAFVLPLGVGGGLVMALVAGSRLLWSVLVWFFGDRQDLTASVHFDSASLELAALLVGVLIWWYHRSVLASGQEGLARTEPQRVYEYLVAGIGLVAAAVGVGTLLVTLIEALTPGIDAGMPVVNTLWAAVTLLVVGAPVWWVFWRRVGLGAAVDPTAEAASPARRVYLVVLFGLAGVAAVIALITAAVTLLQDVVAGSLGAATVRSMRYALGTLVGAAAVSAYHGAVFRADRVAGASARPRGPRTVVLIGAVGPELDREVSRATGAHVEVWGRLDHPSADWNVAGLADELALYPGLDVMVLAEGGGHRVVVVDPSGRRAASPDPD
ncbi:hypothetical protein H5399_13360 [Tessaracoccus sp. MC1627]|nr:hypothetical protein [Tessaracoccus sp. MC1627]